MPFTRLRRLLLSSTLALAAVPLVATAQDQPQLRFDIPATSLDEALKAVGRQAGREIMVERFSHRVPGVRARIKAGAFAE